jgi:hypothetical protein
MDCKEGISTKKSPLFNGANYATWIIKIRIYFQALGFGIWESITTGYTDKDEKESCENNEKTIEVILSGLSDYDIVKVMKCKPTKSIWDKTQNIIMKRDMMIILVVSQRQKKHKL